MTTALVIGGGPAGLMAADVLSAAGVQVTVAEQMPTMGRKFLMAGKSGLNLTKAEPLPEFLGRYPGLPAALRRAVEAFGPDEVQRWAEGLEQEVFTGSTGRVFPKVMKASPLLRAWLARLEARGVALKTRWRWTGWGNAAQFETPEGPVEIEADTVIVATGGGSWRRLGSDGAWTKHFEDTAPFGPSNCGFSVAWSPHMVPYFGAPIKATRLTAGPATSRGEWVITKRGIEGGGVYEVSSAMCQGMPLMIDLLPDVDPDALERRWAKRRAKSTVSKFLKSGIGLEPAKVALFYEMSKRLSDEGPFDWFKLLRALPLQHAGALPLDEAISTTGGVQFSALDEDLMLKARPGVFCAGEMLNWDAPTGGYLLTACFATGRLAAMSALAHVKSGKTGA